MKSEKNLSSLRKMIFPRGWWLCWPQCENYCVPSFDKEGFISSIRLSQTATRLQEAFKAEPCAWHYLTWVTNVLNLVRVAKNVSV